MPSSAASSAICWRRSAKSKLPSVMVSSKCLATLYLFTDFSHPHPDLTTPLELATSNHIAHLLELLRGRRNQRFSFVCTQLRKLWIAAGNEPFAGEVGVRKLE